MPDEASGLEAPPAALIGYLTKNEKSLAWVWRAVSALVCFALTSHFLSKEDYNKDQGERAKNDKELAVTLERLNGTLSHYEALVKTLDDHEQRIRVLERDNRIRP